jgi:hypothetical protein
MTGRFEHFDARPGGSYRLVLTYADASAARGTSAADSDAVDARFVEIVPAEGVTAALREKQRSRRASSAWRYELCSRLSSARLLSVARGDAEAVGRVSSIPQ